MSKSIVTAELTAAECKRLDACESDINMSNLNLCIEMSNMADKQVAIAKYTGRSKQTVNQMVAVGEAAEKYDSIIHLPEGWGSLYAMSSLSKTAIRRLCNEAGKPPTQKQIKNFKEYGTIEAPKPTSKPAPKVQTDVDDILDSIVNKATTSLPASTKPKVESAVKSAVKEINTKMTAEFNAEVKKQVNTKVAAEQERLKEYSNELKEKDAALVNSFKKVNHIMTQKEFKFIRALLHPDRHPPEEKAKWEKAFNIFQRLLDNVDPQARKRWGAS